MGGMLRGGGGEYCVRNASVTSRKYFVNTKVMKPDLIKHSPLNLIVRLKSAKASLARNLRLGPTSGMITTVTVDRQPVIFIHNPRAGGSSLERYLGVKRLSHAFP